MSSHRSRAGLASSAIQSRSGGSAPNRASCNDCGVWARFVVCGLCALVVSACGGSPSPAAQIHATVARLQKAAAERIANVLCDLLFPFGQDRPATELTAELKRINGGAGDPSWRKDVALCRQNLPRHPNQFAAYQRYFSRGSLQSIVVHGDTATARWIVRTRTPQPVRFVRAAGKWRFLIGVQ